MENFDQIINSMLNSLSERAVVSLRDENPPYQKVYEKSLAYADLYDRLVSDECDTLGITQVRQLKEYIDCQEQMRYMEIQSAFKQGFNDCIKVLKFMQVI